jgi:hypothetical protein
MKEHELVVLTGPIAEHGLEPGDVGTVVHSYGDGNAFEVEFTSAEGRTITVVTLSAGEVRPPCGARGPPPRAPWEEGPVGDSRPPAW